MVAAAGLAVGLAGLSTTSAAQVAAQPAPTEKGTGTVTTRQVAPARRPGRTDQPGVQPGGQPVAQPGTFGQPGAVNNPGAAGEEQAAVEVPKITTEDGFVEFSRFAEPVELSLLVEIVAETLQLNIFQDPGLSGSIVFNAPVRVKQDRLLTLLKAWLELYGYSLTFDEATEFYMVLPVSKSPYGLDQRLATTRVFPTPGIRPSALKPSIDALLGGSTGTVVGGGNRAGRPGQPGQPGMPEGMPMPDGSVQAMPQGGGGGGGGGSGGGKVTYNDELGVIIAVDTERRLDQIGAIIDQLTKRYADYKITSITLQFVSPSAAKQRILEALGQAPQQTNRNNRPFDEFGNPVQQQPQQQQARTTMDNLAERLTVSPIGNELFFRGLEEERKIIEELVTLIDSQPTLTPKTYRVGASAKAIADLAKQRGMGEVTTIAAPQDQQNRFGNFGFFYDDSMNRRNQQQQPTNGGPVMVVDEGRGQIIYYATTSLHGEMARLIDEIKPDDDSVVMREYALTYAKAEDVESILMGLIREQTPSDNSNSSFLPGGGGGGGRGQPSIVFNSPNPFAGNEVSISGQNSFVIADKPNNQVIVKAPLKEQNQFKELIARLDRRRPQVYVEAQIVAVTGSDTFKLAFETQLINARGSGGVVNTNFGLGQFATGGAITDRKQVRTGLAGATAALIKNDQIPIIINALQTVTDTRVLSRPQLLVDANTEEASVEANSAQPTATRTLSDNSTSDAIGFSGYETAGTKLTIKEPRIGPGDSVQMQIDVELSNFSGESPSPELPPPKNENFIKSQVQVPANMTVVVGGVVVDTKRKTTDKIPLLGDIPLIGALFSSFNNVDDKTTLYVFITPRVLRDERLGDPKLLSAGPMREAGLEERLPPMTPVMVDFVEIRERKPAEPATDKPAEQPAEKPAGDPANTPAAK